MPPSSKNTTFAAKWELIKRSVDGDAQIAFISAVVNFEGMPPEFMKYILEDKDVDMNLADENGNTPLIVACYHGHIHIVNVLLENRADIDHADNNGITSLIWASRIISLKLRRS